MEKDLNYLFNEVPLYVKNEFKIFDNTGENTYVLNKKECDKFVKMFGSNNTKLITRCVKCKKEFPFYVYIKGLVNSYDPVKLSKKFEGSFIYYDYKNESIISKSVELLSNNMIDGNIQYFDYTFVCANDDKHVYKMLISIEINIDTLILRKIGQNPSMIKVKGYDFDKYKHQLEKFDAYDEYCKATLCYNERFSVGAFAYLRRVFEKMLNFFCNGIILQDDHVKTKINAVGNSFDPRIRASLSNMYGILSASIHCIKEEESQEYYEDLKAVIDMQLEYLKTEEEKAQQTKNLQSTLDRISNSYKKNN